MESSAPKTELSLSEKEKMLETCYAYYQMRGYSKEHCDAYVGAREDYEIVITYNAIIKEKEDAEAKGIHLF